jgi:hypothetical protein
VASVLGSYGPSRLDPHASAAPRILKITYDINWEIFYINILEVSLPHPGEIESIGIEVKKEGIDLLLYGISTAD